MKKDTLPAKVVVGCFIASLVFILAVAYTLLLALVNAIYHISLVT